MNIEYDYPCFDCEDSIHSDAIYADDEVHSSLIVETKELLPTNYISGDRKKKIIFSQYYFIVYRSLEFYVAFLWYGY